MPHKRNPVVCERICGLARLVRANALAAMENITLWQERDISHSSVERIIIPDACMALDYMLVKFAWVMEGLKVNADRMQANIDLTGGLTCSQQVLLALIEKGMSREDAYRTVQVTAMQAWNEGGNFREMIGEDPAVRQHLQASELEKLFDPALHLKNVDTIFQRIGL